MVNKNTLRIGFQFIFFGIVSAILLIVIAYEFKIPLNIYSYFMYSITSLIFLIGVIIVITGLTQNN